MSDVDDVIKGIMDIVGAVSGIRAAPDYPPESINVFPFAVCYPGTGRIIIEPAGVMKGLHEIVLEIHVARKDLSRDVQAAIPFVDSIPLALCGDVTFGGTTSTWGAIRYQFMPLGWNGVETIGWRFWIESVKVQTSFSY
jgi:hypothetical protein